MYNDYRTIYNYTSIMLQIAIFEYKSLLTYCYTVCFSFVSLTETVCFI